MKNQTMPGNTVPPPIEASKPLSVSFPRSSGLKALGGRARDTNDGLSSFVSTCPRWADTVLKTCSCPGCAVSAMVSSEATASSSRVICVAARGALVACPPKPTRVARARVQHCHSFVTPRLQDRFLSRRIERSTQTRPHPTELCSSVGLSGARAGDSDACPAGAPPAWYSTFHLASPWARHCWLKVRAPFVAAVASIHSPGGQGGHRK